MQRRVEAGHLVLFADAQCHEFRQYEQDDPGHSAAIDRCRKRAPCLGEDLHQIALDHTGRAANGFRGEDAGQDRADQTADTMQAEGVERIIPLAPAFQGRDAPIGTGRSRH